MVLDRRIYRKGQLGRLVRMETIIVLLIIYAVFVFVMIRGAYDEKKRKQKYRNQLKNLYGSFPQTVCSAEEIARIES